VENPAPILWKPEKLQAGMQKYPPDPPFRPYAPGTALPGGSPGGKASGAAFRKQRYCNENKVLSR